MEHKHESPCCAQAVAKLPQKYRSLLALRGEQAAQVQEIRLCSGAPISLNIAGRLHNLGPAMTAAELEECFYALCGHSVYRCEEQLAEGFFTLEGGHRVGVAGELRYQNGRVAGYKQVCALNIRIARDIPFALPARLAQRLESGQDNLLVVGPPGSGKTTCLKGIIRWLGQHQLRFAVVDPRQELAGQNSGLIRYVGNRADGILYSLRGMNPQYIVCDEIVSPEDIRAIRLAVGSGALVIASFHARDRPHLTARCEGLGLSLTLFGTRVFLAPGDPPGRIAEIWEASE